LAGVAAGRAGIAAIRAGLANGAAFAIDLAESSRAGQVFPVR
jgi:hypothetical protein